MYPRTSKDSLLDPKMEETIVSDTHLLGDSGISLNAYVQASEHARITERCPGRNPY